MKTYKVYYESYFGEDDFESCEITSTDKRMINNVAKSNIGLVFEVTPIGDIYLGKYTYDYSDVWSDEPKVIWKKAK